MGKDILNGSFKPGENLAALFLVVSWALFIINVISNSLGITLNLGGKIFDDARIIYISEIIIPIGLSLLGVTYFGTRLFYWDYERRKQDIRNIEAQEIADSIKLSLPTRR